MKVAIIGAGINGLYLAWKLSEKGHSVEVFEKKEKIGKRACSGLFSERILEFIPQSQKLIQNQIKSVSIRLPKKTLKVEFSKKLLVIDHFKLDNLVADLAEKTGAKISLKYNITRSDIVTFQKGVEEDKSSSSPTSSIERSRKSKSSFDFANARVFDRIIGCDGPNSIVRKNLGLPEPKYLLAMQGFLSTCAQNFGADTDFVDAWPKKQGFIWKIPRGMDTEYGIIGEPKKVKEDFENFLKENNIQAEGIVSGAIPQTFSIPSNSTITLCGDAAGLCKPWSGGGVIWGLIAAELLLKNFPDFLRYKKEVKRIFLPKIIFSKIATKIVYFSLFKMPWILPKNNKIESDFLI